MKVLMLGWEFPPFISGGLGTACYGLTQGMSKLGTEILLVLPRPVQGGTSSHVKLLGPQSVQYEITGNPHIEIKPVDVALYPYGGVGMPNVPAGRTGNPGPEVFTTVTTTGGSQQTEITHHSSTSGGGGGREIYSRDMYTEIVRYAHLVGQIARQERFDVIHAHDWMTYPAGVIASQASGKPLVVHVHSTEFDRSGENVNPWIYEIERYGMHSAKQVIAVSEFTRRICIYRYSVSAEKVQVVYNAISEPVGNGRLMDQIKKDEKVVLFLGRVTMQKGPEYFIAAAKKVLEKVERVKFIMAGSGDMLHRMIQLSAQLGIGQKILFAGFLQGEEVERIYRMADLYVMPSISEPFGIAPLEAMIHDVPVIISRQSGVSEILQHALKVDFWDINELANKIVAVLRHPPLQQTLGQNGGREVRKFRWIDSARKCIDIYKTVQNMAS